MDSTAFIFNVKWPNMRVDSTMLRNMGNGPSVDTDSRQKLLDCILHPAFQCINPLNAELNPICYLLALLGAHHFLHVSRIRVK